jgi:TP901 family phage tail tape measure protein
VALNSLGLGFMFTATDLASGVMDRVQGNLESLADASGKTIDGLDGRLQKFGAGVAAMAIGFGGLSAAFGMANKYGEFEQAIAAVGAVSNATAAELALLKKAALEAGIATQFSPTEATLGLNELAQAGFSAQEQIELLRPALDLAAGSLGQLSPQEAAGIAAQALKAFGIETNLAGVAVDQLLQASNMFAMRADDLPLALGIASRGAQSLNQSLTETIIAVGLVKNVVPGTERAATSVAVAMEKMANPKVQKALTKIGVAAVDATGNFRPFLDILGDMLPALDKMSLADKSAFLQKTFGAESLSGLNAIMSQVTTGIKTNTGETLKGAAALGYLRNQFSSASGVAKEFSDQLLDTFEGQKKLLKGSVETLAIQLGEPFAKALRPAIELTIAVVNKFLEVFGKLPEPVKLTIAVVGLFAFAAIGLAGALVALGAIWPLLVIGAGLAATALGGLATAAWAAIVPLLPFIVIAAIIVGVILALTQNWWGLRDAIVLGAQIIWETMTDAFNTVVGALKSVWEEVSSFATQVFDVLSLPFKLWFGFMKWQFDMAVALFDLVVAALGFAWGHFVAFITDTYIWKALVAGIELIKTTFTSLWNMITAGWNSVVDLHIGVFNRIVDAVMSVLPIVGAFLGGLAEGIALPFVLAFHFISGVVSAVSDHVFGIINRVREAISKVVDWIINLGAKLGGFFADMPSDLHAMAADVRAATPGGTTMAAAVAAAPGANGSTMPAVAGAEAAAAPAAAARAPGIDYDKLAGAMSKRPITTVVEIDGEAVAAATANAQRSSRARAGMPVGAEASP